MYVDYIVSFDLRTLRQAASKRSCKKREILRARAAQLTSRSRSRQALNLLNLIKSRHEMTKVLFRRARKCLSFFTRSEFRGTADLELMKQSGDFSGWFSVCFSHAKIKVYLRDATEIDGFKVKASSNHRECLVWLENEYERHTKCVLKFASWGKNDYSTAVWPSEQRWSGKVAVERFGVMWESRASDLAFLIQKPVSIRGCVFILYRARTSTSRHRARARTTATDNKQHTKHLSIRITRRKMNEPMMSSSSSSLGCVHTWWLFIKEYFMKLSVVVGRRGRVILLDDFFALPLCLSPPFTFIDSSSPQMNIMMTSLCLGPQILSASEQASCCCCKKSCSSIHKKSFGFVCRNTQVAERSNSRLFLNNTSYFSSCVSLVAFGEDCWSIKETKPSIKKCEE